MISLTGKLRFQIEFKYILFHKPAFHQLINYSSENTTVSTRKSVLPQNNRNLLQFLSGSLFNVVPKKDEMAANFFHLQLVIKGRQMKAVLTILYEKIEIRSNQLEIFCKRSLMCGVANGTSTNVGSKNFGMISKVLKAFLKYSFCMVCFYLLPRQETFYQ